MSPRTLRKRFLSLLLVSASAACAVDARDADPEVDPSDAEDKVAAASAGEPSDAISAPLAPSEEAQPEQSPGAYNKGFNEPFVAMSLNVRAPNDSGERSWTVRRNYIRDMLRRFEGGNGPQLVGLQETYQSTLNDLSASLPQYWWYTVNRGDGGMNTIFVRTDRFEVLDRGFRNTTNSQRDDLCGLSDDEDPLNRPIMYVLVRDRITARKSYFYNTHYPSKNSCERKQMSKIVRDYIAARADFSADVILVWDLNDCVYGDGSFNDSYSRLLSYTGLRDAYADIHQLASWSEFTSWTDGWNKTLRHGRKIDHVLISGGLRVRDAYVDKTMFTSAGAIVDCPVVTNGTCGNGMVTNNLRLYSDHWSSWAVLYQ